MTSIKDKLTNEEHEVMETIALHRTESMPPDPQIEFFTKEQEGSVSKQDNTVSNAASETTSFWADMGYMKIEVVMFLYMFSYMMRGVSSTTMIMDKACLVHLGYSEEICGNLAKYPEIKTAVEKLANNYTLGHSLIQMVPSSVLACFIGSWSDKYGRKLPMMIALLGIILDGLGAALCASFFYSRIEYYFIPALFTGFSGGMIGVMSVIFSYGSDTTSFSKRTMKYALMEVTFGLAMPLGQLAGGWLYKFCGYAAVFLLSTAGHILGLIWVMFVIKETRGLDSKESWKVKLRDLWSPQQVVDSFKATVKKRPNKGKEQILALIAAMSFAVFSYASTASINYYYTHHRYNWTNTQYSTIHAIFSVIGTITMLICVPIFKKLNFGDPILGLVGALSLFLKNVATGLANTKEVYYFANLAGLFSGLCTLGGRSRISKVASKDDIGKIFSFLVSAETIVPILSMAVVSQIFNATLEFYPGLVYLLMGGLLTIPVGVFVWIARLPAANYEEIYNNPEKTEDLEKATNKSSQEMTKY